MKTIGIRELKARLSPVLREVAQGDLYLVTDRGRVVAELRQPGAGEPKAISSEERALARMAAEGHLRVAERRPVYRKSPLRLPEGTARWLLDQERAE
jgi:antitoxin (DNA-binding transcriptional repressor) of toxin-antitoxin stability system